MTGGLRRLGLGLMLVGCAFLAACNRGASSNAAAPANKAAPASPVAYNESGVSAPVTKAALREAFRAQGGALDGSCARPSDSIRARCLGLRNLRAQIAARIADWNALPAEAEGFGPLWSTLQESAGMFGEAGSDAERLAALDAAETALHDLERLLDTARR